MAKNEIYGFRDWQLSRRHREWGAGVPMVDCDGLIACEYTHGSPSTLIEYKSYQALGTVDLSHPNYQALAALASGSNIPFFVVYYYPKMWSFIVEPANGRAIELIGTKRKLVSEYTFVKSLYRLRGQKMPKMIGNKLNKVVSQHMRLRVAA